MQRIWFLLLLATICLEGLGRRYLPVVPSVVFYFLKDAVLLYGLFQFRPSATARKVVRYLYRGFGGVLMAAVAWTLVELANPEHESRLLGLIGLRAYWLWWLAPPVVAEVLQRVEQKRRAIYALSVLAIGISILAAFQFAAPPSDDINLYSVVDGEMVYADQAVVGATGRARVASTFSFITGFSDFVILIPALLLSLGLEAQKSRTRTLALAATLCTAAVIPMSGSRASVLLGLGVLIIILQSSGLLFTPIGRRVLIGAGAALVLAAVAFPDAILGVQSRFDDTEETSGRLATVANVLPPVALATLEYPWLGIGTGMQQNARASMHIQSKWAVENEVDRYLVELGPVGYLLVWTAKFGLVVALVRAYTLLKAAGRRGSAGAALSYAALTMFGNLIFDHIWQALYFMGCGFILAEVMTVVRAAEAAKASAVVAPSPGPPAITASI